MAENSPVDEFMDYGEILTSQNQSIVDDTVSNDNMPPPATPSSSTMTSNF